MHRQRWLLLWMFFFALVAGAPDASGQATLAFVNSQGQPLTVALEYSQVTLRAVDPGSAGLGTLQAHVTSDIRGDQMWVSLQEVGSNSGIFSGGVYLNAVP